LVASSSDDLLQPLLGKNELVSLDFHQDVGLVRVNHHTQVCWQRPRRCGPDEYELSWLFDKGEFHEDREVLNCPVFICHLVAGEGCLAAGTPVDDLQSLVEKTFLLGSFNRPPDG